MSWWFRFRHRSRLEEQLDKELRFHLEQHAADLVEDGRDPQEARRLSRLALGGPDQVKEGCRDARGTRWLEDFLQDCRYALRTLRQNTGFATVALLTLGLGIGAATVMFTVVNSVLLKPLPYAEPDRLAFLQEQTDWSTTQGNLWGFTYPNFIDCRSSVRSATLAAWRFGGGTVTRPGEPESVSGREISSELLPLLGATPVRGRAFLPEEDRPGAAPVAIISHGYWQHRFAGSDSAIGATLVLEGSPYTIIGILPASFRLIGSEFDIYTPLGQDTAAYMQNRESHGVRVIARLHPGSTLFEMRSELAILGQRLREQYPKSNRGRTFIADPLRPPVDDVRSTLWLLLGAVGLVLLIACVNIASLLLARAVSRDRELAMRVALGAGRGRLVRQCLTESIVLAVGGGILGTLLAAAGLRPFVTFWPGSLPRAEEVGLDWRVLLFALGVSVLSGVLFGLAPALRVPVRTLDQTLRSGARAVAGTSRRLHGAFVISEIALAVVLLICAGMLGRTLLRLSSLDPGVNIYNVLTARMGLSPATLADPARTRAAWDDILDRARRSPGIEAVAMVDTVPMREGNNPIGYRTSPAAVPDNQQPLALADSVSPDYLKVMGIKLLAGRFFRPQDRLGSESVAVVDDVMAGQAWHGRDPIGQHLWIGLGTDPLTVVGVVGHVRYWGAAADDAARVRGQLYYPFAQVPDRWIRRWSELMSIAVRTSTPPLGLLGSLRHELRGSGSDQVLFEVRTMEELARSSLDRQRFLMVLFGIFAGLALLLACIGIYGVLAYLTSRRVPEFGVRMALGATAGDVRRLVLRQSLGMIVAGVTVGLAAALAASRALQRLVEGMQPSGPATFALMIAVLLLAALAASFFPAQRAGRLDAMKALRQE
jgi:predicted permease